jgi:HD superfamily phosphohydrolase
MNMADPIHGLIRLDRSNPDHRLVLDITNSRPFQRLRRIKQMGLAEFVFPGATHSRFLHSLGSCHLMIQVIDNWRQNASDRALLEQRYPDTNITLARLLLVSILVHDIGHSPLSHTLEDILELDRQGLVHDHHWKRKILTEDPDLQAIWKLYDSQLPHAVLDFMGESPAKPAHFLARLVSSQLDMDRLDYLQRDSHFLGVQYGRIEADRIVSNLELVKGPGGLPVVAVREEALPAVEHYLFGRHQAYKMALHSLDKASESLLKLTLDRFAWCRDQGLNVGHPAEALYQLMRHGQYLSVGDYLRMDDCYLWEAIHEWSINGTDKLLRTLAQRMMTHDLLKFVDMNRYGVPDIPEALTPIREALQTHYNRRGISFGFGFHTVRIQPKPMYVVGDHKEPIWIRTRGGVTDLSELSSMSLTAQPKAGHKHLWFVWDRHAKHFLLDYLQQHYGQVPERTVPAEPEGGLPPFSQLPPASPLAPPPEPSPKNPGDFLASG